MLEPLLIAIGALATMHQPALTAQEATAVDRSRAQLRRCGESEVSLAGRPDSAWVPAASLAQAHAALRRALGEPMPQASTMILMHALSGDLVTNEFSVVLTRDRAGGWSGSLVGRTTTVVGAAPSPLPKKKWRLPVAAAARVDAILGDRCFYAEPANFHGDQVPAPGAVGINLEVVTPQRRKTAFLFGGDAVGLSRELIELASPPQG